MDDTEIVSERQTIISKSKSFFLKAVIAKKLTFPDVRDIDNKLEIAVVLVGTEWASPTLTQRLDAVIKRDEQVYNCFVGLVAYRWQP